MHGLDVSQWAYDRLAVQVMAHGLGFAIGFAVGFALAPMFQGYAR